MRKLVDSDFFKEEINKGNSILGRANAIISGMEPSTVILNEILYPDIKKRIIGTRKEKIVLEMGKAIETGQLVLFTTAPDKRLSDIMPFIVYQQTNEGGKANRAAVNLASIVVPVKQPTGEQSYEMGDPSKVFSILYGAYLAVDRFPPTAIVDPNVLYDSSVLWADMFTKPIFDTIGLYNPERNEAFMYFAIKFFLIYMMGCKEEQANAMAKKYLRGSKNDQILLMEDAIQERQIDLYTGLLPFMNTIFNNEITQIKGVRVSNLDNTLNASYYVSRFVMSFGTNALLALCTFPYFIYIVIASYGKSKMIKDKAFDNVFSRNKRELNRLLRLLQK